MRKSSLKEQTANATCGPLQCILQWEIVRKVKRASFPCVAFFPCRLHMICMVICQGILGNVLVKPNRVSWLKRHFARIRYGPRSGTGRIPFCRRAAWYGRCVHPTSTLQKDLPKPKHEVYLWGVRPVPPRVLSEDHLTRFVRV